MDTACRPELLEAVHKFSDVFADGGMACEIAPAFTCVEVNAIARIYRALGHPSLAEMWVTFHKDGTGEDDIDHLTDGDSDDSTNHK